MRVGLFLDRVMNDGDKIRLSRAMSDAISKRGEFKDIVRQSESFRSSFFEVIHMKFPLEIGLTDLIHPLIFRRRSFATVGTNFD